MTISTDCRISWKQKQVSNLVREGWGSHIASSFDASGNWKESGTCHKGVLVQDVSRKKRLIYKQNQSPKPLTWVFQRMPLVFQLLLRVIVSPHIDIKKSHVSCSCAPSIMHSVCKLLPEEKTNRRWFLKYYSLAPQQVLRCRDKQQKPVIARRSPCCRRLAWKSKSDR